LKEIIMAYNAGITRYQKKKWMDELVAKIGAGSLKCSIHSTTTTWDATTDPATPQVYATTGELTSSGTGYTAGGFTLSGASLTASGNAYQLDFADLVTGAGTIGTGTYCACIYDTTDSNRILAICTVNVTQASAGGAMTFSVPSNALALS
jgi:hypothetical protein